jgi:ankyrin repeat protein
MGEFLILSGADVNAQNDVGDTPLHMVTRTRDIPAEGQFLRNRFVGKIVPQEARKATFRMLHFRKANMRITNVHGANAIHLAAHAGDLLALDELLSSGGLDLIDEVDAKGLTALALAIACEHVDCIKRLINMGADLKFRLPNGTRLDEICQVRKKPN